MATKGSSEVQTHPPPARGMASDRDSEDEALEGLEFEEGSEVEDEIDEDFVDAIEPLRKKR